MNPRESSSNATSRNGNTHRKNVQAAMKKAQQAAVGNPREYGAIDWLLDRSTVQTRAAMLAVMELAGRNDLAWEHILERLRQEMEPVYEQIGTDTGDVDVEMAALWLSLATGILTGYERAA
jgi:hypothetical protein